MSKVYETPEIKTLRASEIVELMGPVSCGSGPAGGGVPGAIDLTDAGANSSGLQHFD